MESWRRTWREGVGPLLSEKSLAALEHALASDDVTLIQRATTSPPPLACVQDWPVEGACALGFCGWAGEGLKLVGEVEEFFARMCYAIDQRLGETAICRHFLNYWDEGPRGDVFREVLLEVRKTLTERHKHQQHAA